MNQLKLYFSIFFVVLIIPTSFLLYENYKTVNRDAFLVSKRISEVEANSFYVRLFEILQREENRSYSEYRYLYASSNPISSEPILNLSPLSQYPVKTQIPGFVGYFQWDPDKSFHTPLLSNNTNQNKIPNFNERKALQNQLFDIVTQTTIQTNTSQDRDRLGMSVSAWVDTVLTEDANSKNVLMRNEQVLIKTRTETSSPEALYVFEPKLKKVDWKRGRVARFMLNASSPAPQARVEAFQVQHVETRWLIFYRNIFWNGQRYIQGFVINSPEFFGQITSQLVGIRWIVSDHDVVYRSEPEREKSKPYLIYQTALPPPLSIFRLLFVSKSIPKPQNLAFLRIFSIAFLLVVSGGFYGIYRMTAAERELLQKKGDFVSAISHELKTPLTSIRMYGDLLAQDRSEEKKKSYVQYIQDESERLTRLIENVLQLVRLEKKDWEIRPEKQDPVQLVQAVVNKLEVSAGRVGLALHVMTEGNPKEITTDRDALTQILINLIDNAMKFSKDSSEKSVLIRVMQISDQCWIRVRDFGPGIPHNQMKKIFEKFYRVENESTRSTQGTGIGLSLVRMLADQMKIRIKVENKEPGTEFNVIIPS